MTRSLFDTTPAKSLGRRPPRRSGPFTRAELEHCRAFAARLVLRHGEQLMPIFERLDRECRALAGRDETLERVRAIASMREVATGA